MRAEQPRAKAEKVKTGTASKADYQNRIWMTRPRPGIDRVSSGWLITRFIDPKATFVFGKDPSAQEGAIPFDMFQAGFGHEGDNCTFETLCHAFRVTDKKVQFIAQTVNDADLEDDKFGRSEGNLINQILQDGPSKPFLTKNCSAEAWISSMGFTTRFSSAQQGVTDERNIAKKFRWDG
jgi:hypothetical protein